MHTVGYHSENFVTLPQGSTDMMDFSTEKYALLKRSFNETRAARAEAKRGAPVELIPPAGGRDLIHHPKTTTGLLDGMEEGAMVNDKLIENILSGIKNTINKNGNELKISEYYTTTSVYGIEVSNWKVVDFGEGNKFTVASNIHKVLVDANKNIIKLNDKTETISKRKYLTVDGNCLTISFKYKERDNVIGLEVAVPEAEAEKFKEYLFKKDSLIRKPVIEQVIKDDAFTYQSETGLNCFETCKKILKNAGIENVATEKIHMACNINRTNGKSTYDFHPECLKKGIEVLDEFLEKGQPVIVGVDYRPDYDINEGVADHYIVVVARGNDKKGVFYRYFEVYRAKDKGGISDNNKLHFNPKGYLEGPCTCSSKYDKFIVTIVRPNGAYNFKCCNRTDYKENEEKVKKDCKYRNSENENCTNSIKP